MRSRRERLHLLPGALLIVAVATVVTWVAASAALSDLRPSVLAAGFESSLRADYGSTEAQGSALSPIDATIADSVAQDERDLGERGAAEVTFAPIFLADEGNQEPIRLPSGDVQPAATLIPTQTIDLTATPAPTPLNGPTLEPRPTEPGQPTPAPQITATAQPTSRPNPTKTEQPTSEPNPTKTDQPTSEPKPTKTDQPTSEPKPTQPNQPTPKPNPTHPPHPTPKP
ncbi:MAG: hypothetical protein ABR978_03390 [Dehalococcoidia bacterium]|jgi:hypothetical protein